MGARGIGGWTDISPLLHAIRAVDATSFLALLLGSPLVCVETEDDDDTCIDGGEREGGVDRNKKDKRKKSKRQERKERKKRRKKARRRNKEMIAHISAFWDRLREELAASMQRIDFGRNYSSSSSASTCAETAPQDSMGVGTGRSSATTTTTSAKVGEEKSGTSRSSSSSSSRLPESSLQESFIRVHVPNEHQGEKRLFEDSFHDSFND